MHHDDAELAERGRKLYYLLLLADRLPPPIYRRPLRFPRLDSRPDAAAAHRPDPGTAHRPDASETDRPVERRDGRGRRT